MRLEIWQNTFWNMAKKVGNLTFGNLNNKDCIFTATTAKMTATATDIILLQKKISESEVYILNKELTELRADFQAETTKHNLFDWKNLTTDPEVLKTVSGLPIESTNNLIEDHHHNYSHHQYLIIDN